VHLVGFIIRIYHDARFSECQRSRNYFYSTVSPVCRLLFCCLREIYPSVSSFLVQSP